MPDPVGYPDRGALRVSAMQCQMDVPLFSVIAVTTAICSADLVRSLREVGVGILLSSRTFGGGNRICCSHLPIERPWSVRTIYSVHSPMSKFGFDLLIQLLLYPVLTSVHLSSEDLLRELAHFVRFLQQLGKLVRRNVLLEDAKHLHHHLLEVVEEDPDCLHEIPLVEIWKHVG